MATENRCPKCGDLLTDFNRGGELVFDCHYDKKDCRIKELERQLEEANDSIHAMHSDCSGFVVQIGSLESERDTLKSALIQRNAQLGVACLKHDLIHALECAGCYREIQSELDAALAQVAVLRDDLRVQIGRSEGKNIIIHELEAKLSAEKSAHAATKEELRKADEALIVATEIAQDMRGYCRGWDWKYGMEWDAALTASEQRMEAALNRQAQRAADAAEEE